MENTRGSEWRKWDLHLHTASSYDYKYKGADPDKKLIETLKNNDISVVAITDHFVIDKDRILNLRKIASDMSYNLVIFPGVELRTDKGGSNIHPIIIFDCETDLNILTEEFNSFKRKKAIDDENNETIRWDFKDIVTFANDNNGIITIHAGNKKNGIDEQISNVLPVKIATKDEYAQTVNILEIGKLEDIDEYKKYKFPKIGIKPFIMGSDNHNPNKYPNEHNTNLFTWIKADTTFEGLKQIIYEPEYKERVYIKETDPTLDYDKSPFTEIEITDNVKVFAKDENGNNIEDEDNIVFAKNTIPFNSGLVSIIGGRGTGKSKLIDYIANGLGKTVKLSEQYTRSEQMCVKRKVSLREDNFVFKLNEEHNIPFMYISQSEIKDVVENNEMFSKIIFDLIGISNKDIFYDYNKDYVNYFFIYWVLRVANVPSPIDEIKEIDSEIKKYESFISNSISESNKDIFEKCESALEVLELLNNYLKNAKKAEEAISSLHIKHNDIFSALTSNLNYDELNIHTDIVNVLNEENNTSISNITNSLIDKNLETIKGIEEYTSVINSKINKLNSFIEETKKQLPDYILILVEDVIRYRKKIKSLKEKKSDIEMAEENLYDYYSHFSRTDYEIFRQMKEFEENINKKWLEFVNGKDSYSEDKKSLLKEILGEDSDKIDLHVKFFLDKEKLRDNIESRHTHFFTNSGNKIQDKESQIMTQQRLNLINSITDLESYFNLIKYDPNGFNKILAHTPYILELYTNFNDYIKYQLVITSNNKPMNKLSVGQRGTIYLKLQLAANLFSETIMYDQPEDDLDNEFITENLVNLFKKIKKYRQIIIVSHNANLVVNADSEQVIVASNNDGVLSYKSGSLENPEIKTEICRILEGGKEAFDKRKLKYGF